MQVVKELSSQVYEESGIEIPLDSVSFHMYPDPEKKYIEGRIGYIGPLQNKRGGIPKIKLDLNATEKVIHPGQRRKIYHPYSDKSGFRSELQ